MGNILRYSVLLGKRWVWLLLIAAVLSGSINYLVSTFLHPVYQASAYLIIDRGTSTYSGDNGSGQTLAAFAQSIKMPAVLAPVAELHPGMKVQDLADMISVRPQSGAQIIDLDVQADNPRLATDLADQMGQSFAQYVSTSSPGIVRIMAAQEPSLPVQPHPLTVAGLGVAIGVFLMLVLIVLLEWIGNRATSVEQIQDLLATEIMTLVPRFSRRSRLSKIQQATSEKYRMVCASINVAQASRAFKLVMFTSALAGEGKSTIASNVAMHLAQAGKQVLLVDLNISRPALTWLFRLKSQPGLTDLLAGKNTHLQLETFSRASEVAGLQVLASGSRHMRPSELLQSLSTTQFFSRLQQSAFDYVIFDAPSLLSGEETRIMASSMEAIVLVVNGSCTPRRVLERTRQILWRIQTARLLGVVINQSSWRDHADTHPYPLPSPQPEWDGSDAGKQVTMEVPVVTTMLLPSTQARIEPAKRRLPDTGETEQVRSSVSEYVIRPSLSLTGLAAPNNGLTRRVFHTEAPANVPQSLQNG